MKKLLLTLGSAAAIAAPVIATISCSKSNVYGFSSSYDSDAKVITIKNINVPSILDDYDYYTYLDAIGKDLNDTNYAEATSVVFVGKVEGLTGTHSANLKDVKDYLGFKIGDKLSDIFDYGWMGGELVGVEYTAESELAQAIIDASQI